MINSVNQFVRILIKGVCSITFRNRISLFVATFLIIGFFFLALPEKGITAGPPGLSCCQNVGSCMDSSKGVVLFCEVEPVMCQAPEVMCKDIWRFPLEWGNGNKYGKNN